MKKDKIYQGNYRYLNNNTPYAEETFNVFKVEANQSLVYESEIISRVDTGEFLKINVNYHTTSKWFPLEIEIQRSLGNKTIEEYFISDKKNHQLTYLFKDADENKNELLGVPPSYHISTPSALTAFLFHQLKRFDPGSRNAVTVISSDNDWKFSTAPSQKAVYFQNASHDPEKIQVGEQKLLARKFYIHEQDVQPNLKNQKVETPVIMYISKHIKIPYLIIPNDSIRIEIVKLKDLQEESLENLNFLNK